MIQKTLMMLLIVSGCFYSVPSIADDMINDEIDDNIGMIGVDNTNSDLLFVEPAVAQTVISKHFGNIVSDYKVYHFADNTTDQVILDRVATTYITMLNQNGGLISVSGIKEVCFTAFSDVQIDDDSTRTQLATDVENRCKKFAEDLITVESEMEYTCPYEITKVNSSQKQIKYTYKDGTGKGFIRKNGTIPWRFFNPGAIRRSDLACAILSTKPNGNFAVFENYDTGHRALINVWKAQGYQKLTVEQAMYNYAPPTENNTAYYVGELRKAGINVGKRVSTLTEKEFDYMIKMIEKMEGWGGKGIIEEF